MTWRWLLPGDEVTTVRFFHEIYGIVHELPDNGHFPYERGLQESCEENLRTLDGAEFFDTEHFTRLGHSRCTDTWGIDSAGRPVVLEYG